MTASGNVRPPTRAGASTAIAARIVRSDGVAVISYFAPPTPPRRLLYGTSSISRSGPKKNREQRAKLGGRNDRPERTDRSSTTRLRSGNHTFELHLAPELESLRRPGTRGRDTSVRAESGQAATQLNVESSRGQNSFPQNRLKWTTLENCREFNRYPTEHPFYRFPELTRYVH